MFNGYVRYFTHYGINVTKSGHLDSETARGYLYTVWCFQKGSGVFCDQIQSWAGIVVASVAPSLEG